MVLAETNRLKQLLHLSFVGHVTLEELQQNLEEVVLLLAELPAGITLLTDLSHLESMDIDCGTVIARVMELVSAKGIKTVIRVIPDARKDIGFNILTAFHYPKHLPVITCESIEGAIRSLRVGDGAPAEMQNPPVG